MRCPHRRSFAKGCHSLLPEYVLHCTNSTMPRYIGLATFSSVMAMRCSAALGHGLLMYTSVPC